MSKFSNENSSDVAPSEFEREHKLIPLGDDYEARAKRAETLLNAILPQLLEISVVVPQAAAKDVVSLQSLTETALDEFRNDATLKENKAWEDAYSITEAYE